MKTDMALNEEKKSSQALLTCGNGPGLTEKLLLRPKSAGVLQTERLPTSSVLARLQSFLPQMAEANEKLRQQMEEAPAGHFDIETVDEAQRVIEMDVAVVELSGSDSDCESEDDPSSDSSEDDEPEITEQNLKLPGDKGNKKKKNNNKASIQVLDQQGK